MVWWDEAWWGSECIGWGALFPMIHHTDSFNFQLETHLTVACLYCNEVRHALFFHHLQNAKKTSVPEWWENGRRAIEEVPQSCMCAETRTSLTSFCSRGPPPARLQSLNPHTSTIVSSLARIRVVGRDIIENGATKLVAICATDRNRRPMFNNKWHDGMV
jgi:hypothetical protein